MSRQLTFEGFGDLGTKRFGGSDLKGNPRVARPISLRKPIHLVLKSQLAKGQRSFLRRPYFFLIQKKVKYLAKLTGVRVYRYVNSGDRLHLIVSVPSRRAFHKFIRSLTGQIARIVLDAERGRAQDASFWQARPFTRILSWKKEYKICIEYLLKKAVVDIGFSTTEKSFSSA